MPVARAISFRDATHVIGGLRLVARHMRRLTILVSIATAKSQRQNVFNIPFLPCTVDLRLAQMADAAV
jgi:hypothetical protein